MIEGAKLVLGGREFVAPPLPLKIFRTKADWIKAVSGLSELPGPVEVEAITGLVHASLVRNYPELTVQEVEDLLDVVNMGPAIEAVMGVSGMKRPAGAATGEAPSPQS